MAKRAAARACDPAVSAGRCRRAAPIREARTAAKAQIARSPATYGALRALSLAMKLDLLLFGRVTSGPFFALLEKTMLRLRLKLKSPESACLRALSMSPEHEDPLLRHRPDRARHDGRIGPRHGGRRRARGARARGPRARDAGRRTVSRRPASPVHWIADGAAVRRAGSCGGCAPARSGASSRRCSPTSIIERYYNFGGEGVMAAAAAARRDRARGQRAGHRSPGSPKAPHRSRAARRADAALARAHLRRAPT